MSCGSPLLFTVGESTERQYRMSEPKTYTLEELANLLNWHKAALKVIARKLNIDPTIPIEDIDAEAIAEKIKRPWPPKN